MSDFIVILCNPSSSGVFDFTEKAGIHVCFDNIPLLGRAMFAEDRRRAEVLLQCEEFGSTYFANSA